ncbi:FliM/FliN family flagellar motor switch protein [Pseudomonas poae]|uniref:YscQ/HrcQ family type III secretion apparatus protein n=1 Tax=Pseudomonas poae TaxID=200451 RepID=A0A2S9EP93_9PSED|nr:FliM/FliN family flagellar motor switch protein [Pseudomonas poae]PRA26374.1 YscQ/HrcQ family type III secretion apparatus protein [Pseudomonas poae]PRC17294.1 YscQ/HrcQ family type III secretion apparatus protein [Pseudomonas poae]
MMISALALPAIDNATAAAVRRLGRGLRLSFETAGQHGELVLEPGHAPIGQSAFGFETACGVLAFGEPGPVLSLLGECPVTLAAQGNDPDAWFWAYFQHQLSPQVQSLLGFLRLQPSRQPAAFSCRLTVTLGASRVVDRLEMAPDTFLALCAAGPWQAMVRPLPGLFPLSVSLLLGHSQLPIRQVSNLRPGDVLMLNPALFNPRGDGHVCLGRHRLHGRLADDSGPLRFTLFSIEDSGVDEVLADQGQGYDWAESSPEGNPAAIDVLGHEPFDELQMNLSVRCGALQLSLGELRQLAPGAVVGVSGYAPGMAGLYYGDRPIGQGKLVDVDGRLGLQLSRVIFTR